MVAAIKSRDYLAIQRSVLVISITFSVVMLLVDILYAYIDPSIKSQYHRKKIKNKLAMVGLFFMILIVLSRLCRFCCAISIRAAGFGQCSITFKCKSPDGH